MKKILMFAFLFATAQTTLASVATATNLVNAGNLAAAIQEINRIPKEQWQDKKQLLLNIIKHWDPASQPELTNLLLNSARQNLTAGHSQEVYQQLHNKVPSIPAAPPVPPEGLAPVVAAGGRMPTEKELAEEIARRNAQALQEQITQLQQQIKMLQKQLDDEKVAHAEAEKAKKALQAELNTVRDQLAAEKSAQIKAENRITILQGQLDKERTARIEAEQEIKALENEVQRLKDLLAKKPQLTATGPAVITLPPTKPQLTQTEPTVVTITPEEKKEKEEKLAASKPEVITIPPTKPQLRPTGPAVIAVPPTKSQLTQTGPTVVSLSPEEKKEKEEKLAASKPVVTAIPPTELGPSGTRVTTILPMPQVVEQALPQLHHGTLVQAPHPGIITTVPATAVEAPAHIVIPMPERSAPTRAAKQADQLIEQAIGMKAALDKKQQLFVKHLNDAAFDARIAENYRKQNADLQNSLAALQSLLAQINTLLPAGTRTKLDEERIEILSSAIRDLKIQIDKNGLLINKHFTL